MKRSLLFASCAIALMTVPSAFAQDSDLDQAKEMSSQSGRPMLAVAGEAAN